MVGDRGYDLGACAYAVLTRDRASLRGRLAGLGGAHIARKRRVIQARRTVAMAELERWLLPSPSVGETLRLRRRIAQLVKWCGSGRDVEATLRPWVVGQAHN